MKNFKIASAIALALGIAVVGSASAAASSGGTITFNGALTDQTCTIKGGSGTDGGTGSFIVALDTIPATDIKASGDTAAWKPFAVIIGGPGEGTCENGKVAHMAFEVSSPRIDAATGALTNALTGEATNAEIQVTKSDKTAINLADPANGVDSPAIANNTATINLGAQYLGTGAATAGKVSTSVLYGVTYN